MKTSKVMICRLRKLAAKTSSSILLILVAGCGATDKPAPSTSNQTQGAPGYFAPLVAGSTSPQVPIYFPQRFTIDDKNNTFSQDTYFLSSNVVADQTVASGLVTTAQRGLRNLGITVSYIFDNAGRPLGQTNYPPAMPKSGSLAVEFAGQAGALVQMVGLPVTPMVAATQCPGQKTQTYQFLSIAAPLFVPTPPNPDSQPGSWSASTDTAYGSVDISGNGSGVTFQNIHQFTFPSVGGSGAPLQPAASSLTGACGSTSFGYLTGVPEQAILSDPTPNGTNYPPQASIGINPAGLLVEDTGSWALGRLPNTNPPLPYNNVLGAGTGAVGLLKPSSSMDTTALVGAQYLGFVYSSGIFSGVQQPPVGLTSHLTSFGFSGAPTLPSKCSLFATQTGSLVNGIYGGDYPQNNGQDNPSASSDGFGNCDLAVDLGPQDASNNGLFSKATVWLGGSYVANAAAQTYSFPAVAIAGQLNGKNAIFLLGLDSTQSWSIYLLQSN